MVWENSPKLKAELEELIAPASEIGSCCFNVKSQHRSAY
jgi:hypothetical protein